MQLGFAIYSVTTLLVFSYVVFERGNPPFWFVGKVFLDLLYVAMVGSIGQKESVTSQKETDKLRAV